MKPLKSTDPKRQHRWSHNRHIYSIVDLCIFPKEADGSRYTPMLDSLEYYRAYNYELAEMEKDGHVEVLGRYTSFEEAEEAIKSGECHDTDTN